MTEIIILTLLCFPTVIELVEDYRDHKKDKRDDKVGDVVRRGILILLMAVIAKLFGAPSIWQAALLSTGIFVMFFDYFMGMLLTNNPFFLGTTSQSDMKLKIWPWYLLLLARGVFFAATVTLYYI
jgi:hypothetical protein